jgi:hypothetical protein
MSDEYHGLADLARHHARIAMHQGKPVTAREWIEAAKAADEARRDAAAAPPPLERIAAALEEWDFELQIGGPVLERIADALVHLAGVQEATSGHGRSER